MIILYLECKHIQVLPAHLLILFTRVAPRHYLGLASLSSFLGLFVPGDDVWSGGGKGRKGEKEEAHPQLCELPRQRSGCGGRSINVHFSRLRFLLL